LVALISSIILALFVLVVDVVVFADQPGTWFRDVRTERLLLDCDTPFCKDGFVTQVIVGQLFCRDRFFAKNHSDVGRILSKSCTLGDHVVDVNENGMGKPSDFCIGVKGEPVAKLGVNQNHKERAKVFYEDR